MKKYVGLFALWAMVVAGFYSVAHSAQTCANTDFECYESGPSQNLSTPWRVDSSGNLTTSGGATIAGSVALTGSQTTVGKTIYTPTSATALSTQSTISPTATYITVVSTGGNVVLGQGAPYVAIATASATNGQILVLGSTVSSNGATVTITSGAAAGCDLGSATRTLSYGKRLGLIYDSAISMWTELFYGSN